MKKDDNQEEKNLKTVILLNPKNEEAILNLAFLKKRKSNYTETKKLIKDLKKFAKLYVKKHLIWKKVGCPIKKIDANQEYFKV